MLPLHRSTWHARIVFNYMYCLSVGPRAFHVGVYFGERVFIFGGRISGLDDNPENRHHSRVVLCDVIYCFFRMKQGRAMRMYSTLIVGIAYRNSLRYALLLLYSATATCLFAIIICLESYPYFVWRWIFSYIALNHMGTSLLILPFTCIFVTSRIWYPRAHFLEKLLLFIPDIFIFRTVRCSKRPQVPYVPAHIWVSDSGPHIWALHRCYHLLCLSHPGPKHVRFTSNKPGVQYQYRVWDTYNFKELRPWTPVVSKTDIGEHTKSQNDYWERLVILGYFCVCNCFKGWLSWRLGGPGDGEYTLYLRAIDPAGNR